MGLLTGKTILLPLGPDFEDREVVYPLYRLREEGATVVLAGIGEAQYKGKYGIPLAVEAQCDDVVNQHWDAVIVPGGWAPDKMRMNQGLLAIVRRVAAQPRGVVAAICHGGWVLTSADVVRGRKVTSYIAIKDDMVHAGGHWEDAEVVVDEPLVTSRKPDDLPAFCKAIIHQLTAS